MQEIKEVKIDRDFKTIKEYIDNIEEINHEKCWLLLDDNKTKYCLLNENDKFIIKRNIKENEVSNINELKYITLNKKVFSNTEKENIVIIDSMFKSYSFLEMVYSISSFESESFRKNKFFKLVINSEKDLLLHHIFSNLIHVSTGMYNGITFEIKDIPFYLYYINDYFVIENLQELDFEVFEEYSRIVQICFGLLTGYVPRKEGYYFSYENNQFKNTKEYAYTSSFVDTYDVGYKPINIKLFHNFMPNSISRDEINKFTYKAQDNLFSISRDTFSELCTLNVTNKKISRATELIMEANQTSLEAQGIVYSVVLEILTSYIAQKNEDTLTPIANKCEANKLRTELHDIARKYLSDYEDSPIYKKINSINSPTNKDKLLMPFRLLNIPLTDVDKKIINHRNDFLHGNDFVDGEEVLAFIKNHFYINCKLNFLVYALLLKIIGHHGKIVNMVKIYSEKDEECYRDIGEKVG